METNINFVLETLVRDGWKLTVSREGGYFLARAELVDGNGKPISVTDEISYSPVPAIKSLYAKIIQEQSHGN